MCIVHIMAICISDSTYHCCHKYNQDKATLNMFLSCVCFHLLCFHFQAMGFEASLAIDDSRGAEMLDNKKTINKYVAGSPQMYLSVLLLSLCVCCVFCMLILIFYCYFMLILKMKYIYWFLCNHLTSMADTSYNVQKYCQHWNLLPIVNDWDG